jgi:hypothetical protein
VGTPSIISFKGKSLLEHTTKARANEALANNLRNLGFNDLCAAVHQAKRLMGVLRQRVCPL